MFFMHVCICTCVFVWNHVCAYMCREARDSLTISNAVPQMQTIFFICFVLFLSWVLTTSQDFTKMPGFFYLASRDWTQVLCYLCHYWAPQYSSIELRVRIYYFLRLLWRKKRLTSGVAQANCISKGMLLMTV